MYFEVFSVTMFAIKSTNLNQALNPVALRKAKILCNFGLSECNRVKVVCRTHLSNTSLLLILE